MSDESTEHDSREPRSTSTADATASVGEVPAGEGQVAETQVAETPITETTTAGRPASETASAETPTEPRRRHLVAVTFGVAAAVVALDQLTKALAVRYLEGKPPVEILGDWLSLDFLRNPGAAFSFGTGFTFVFPLIAIAVVVVIVRKSRELGSLAWAIALGGMLGGAVGNLIDRIFRDPGMLQGHVVDFVFVKHFAVFNLADAAITCSAVLMVVLALLGVDLDGRKSS